MHVTLARMPACLQQLSPGMFASTTLPDCESDGFYCVCPGCFDLLLYRHGDFVSRYKILLPPEKQDIVLSNEAQTRAAVLQLLGVFKVPEGQFEMGRTKVFFKPGEASLLDCLWYVAWAAG